MRHDLADLPQLFEDEMLDNVGSIAEVQADPDEAYVRVVLRVRGFEGFDERRVVECRDAVRWHLTDDGIYWFRVHDEHPALLPFTDEQGDLYFNGTPRDPSRVADSLRAISARLLGRYYDFDACINNDVQGLAGLLGGGHGKVATGPLTLLRAFQDALEDDGVGTSLLGTGEPKMYVEREAQWVPVPRQLSMLDLGESWVVARSFSCCPA